MWAGKNRLKDKARHWRVPVSCALLAAWGSQIPPHLPIRAGSRTTEQLSRTTNKPKYVFPILRKPAHYSKHKSPLAELPSFTLGLDLLTSCIVNTRCPFCLSTNQHLEGKPAASLLLQNFCPVCLQCNPALIYVWFTPGQFLYFHWHWRSVFKDKSFRLQYAMIALHT